MKVLFLVLFILKYAMIILCEEVYFMEQELDILYNIPNIKLFLDIFGLEMEEKEKYRKGDQLLIFRDDIEAGHVVFQEEEIKIDALSLYGG